MIFNLLSFVFLGTALVSARDTHVKNHKLKGFLKASKLKSEGKGNLQGFTVEKQKHLQAAGTTPVWVTETYYDNDSCAGNPQGYYVYDGTQCISDGTDSYAIRYSETQPGSGCGVDVVDYSGTSCAGTGTIDYSYTISGTCQAGQAGGWNDLGQSGVITCSSSNPGIPAGVDLTNSVTDLYYLDSATCGANNNFANGWLNMGKCFTFSAANEDSDNGAIGSAKYSKTSTQIIYNEYTDTACTTDYNSSSVPLGSCFDFNNYSFFLFSSTSMPTATPTRMPTATPTVAPSSAANVACHLSVVVSIMLVMSSALFM